MHAHGHRSTALMLVVAMTITIGCRGSRPFGRFVQVTRDADADLPDIEPPRQRLATTKSREDSGQMTSLTMTDRSPHAMARPSATSPTTKPSTGSARQAAIQSQSPAAQSEGVQRTLTSRPSTSKPAVSPTQQSTARTPSTQTASLGNGPDPTSMDPAELIRALKDYPPEVQREALRRMSAVSAQTVDTTSQPNSLDSELAKNALNLPKLPDPKNSVPEVPPKRIAADGAADKATTVSISDAAHGKASPDTATSSGRVTDLVTTELESTVVQADSDSAAAEDKGVKQASAARKGSEDLSVATAAVVSASPAPTPNAEPSGADADQISDKALYATLLRRLSEAAPDESESQRNGRLIRLRHLMVLAGDPDAAVGEIDGMSDHEQEFLRHQLLGLWTMIDPEGHPVPSRRFTTALPQIREAAKFAAAATDSLEVRSLAFCTEIESYGQIKTFPGNRFDAGQQVILYCEIENFTVNKTEEGFETHLQGSYDIYNADNEKVVSQLLPADQQVSANYLRDYFIAYQMHLPQQLSPGTYRIQLTMEDVGGKKYGQSSIPFEIAK